MLIFLIGKVQGRTEAGGSGVTTTTRGRVANERADARG